MYEVPPDLTMPAIETESQLELRVAAAPTIIPLSMLSDGEVGRVAHIHSDCDMTARLRELGLQPGVSVEMIRSGHPCIVRLAGQQLCLRSEALQQILIELNEPWPR